MSFKLIFYLRKSENQQFNDYYHWRYLSFWPIKGCFLVLDDDGLLQKVEKGVFDVHCVVKSTPETTTGSAAAGASSGHHKIETNMRPVQLGSSKLTLSQGSIERGAFSTSMYILVRRVTPTPIWRMQLGRTTINIQSQLLYY